MSDLKRIKPALSKGTRDFLPSEVAKRNYIFETIKSVFRKYGFEQIETPAIERLETLTGKYGEEGDKLLFKILNSGDYLAEVRKQKTAISELEAKDITPLIAEKGLRYDLTVPLARYVVQHQDNLAFPFKRFHIGPVWRADRPQKGRYQEFYQCDADVIGSKSIVNEAELILIYIEAFKALGIDITILYNHRLVLKALADISGIDVVLFCNILDRLDKIGIDKTFNEFTNVGVPNDVCAVLKDLFSRPNHGQMHLFENIFSGAMAFESTSTNFSHEEGKQGLLELISITDFLSEDKGKVELSANVKFDISLARGLNYYTGMILEVRANNAIIGSLGGGGRYDNLTEMFGGQNMSGVGISFGIERIYDVMEELNLFPDTISQGVRVLFVPRDSTAEPFAFEQVQQLRNQNIPAEIFLGNVKKQKHFSYVEQKNIPFIVEVGANEVQSGKFILRNTKTRTTTTELDLNGIAEVLSQQ